MQSKRLTAAAAVLFTATSLPGLSADSAAVDAASKCEALFMQDKFSEAQPYCYKAGSELGKDGLLLYGRFFERQGDATRAIAGYSEVLRGYDPARPTTTELAALRRRALVRSNDGDSDALRDAEAFLKHVPDDVDMLKVAARFSNSRKLEYTERLAALEPGSAEGHVQRAQALLGSGNAQEALASAQLALKREPKSVAALAVRAQAYAAMGEHVKSERDFAAIARMHPDDADVQLARAEVLIMLERFDDAIVASSEALRIRPDDPRAFYIRTMARMKLGDGEGALADIDAGSGIAPDDWWDETQMFAEEMIAVQRAFQPTSIAQLEQDFRTVSAAVAANMHATCGYYAVTGDDSDAINAELRKYRGCMIEWNKIDGRTTVDSFDADALQAAQRLGAALKLKPAADVLRCSKMPKKSRCITDEAYARAEAALTVNPKVRVAGAEFDRLNQEVGTFNASVRRQNTMIKTASFLEAVAAALSAE